MEEAVSKKRNLSMSVCIGGDSTPASVHGSPFKRNPIESVSTDLYALSRGFIPGGIVVPSGMETYPTGVLGMENGPVDY